MFLLIFCGFCAQKLWRVRTSSEIQIELKRFLFLKLSDDQKTNEKGLHPKMEWLLCPKLREDQKKKIFSLNWSSFCG